MKLCIPTETNEGLNAPVFGHFGSAPFFTMVDTDTRAVQVVDNTNAHHEHGMCHPLGVLGTAAFDAVVCQGMGTRAVQKLNDAGIKAFRAQAQTVEDVIKQYIGNELSEITVDNACAQHGCH
ncbi:MAG TPA: NifB/NifX family molybdenum-iron cluster-binding protein [Candidatus Bathyarchaeia archaeon]|nr:NifB/NifX family molybdenum-iron cluster-binding protein [Candidatus Bathyarchaeia archaeon]